MRVTMVTTAAGPGGVYRAGETWDVEPATANQLLAGGYATPVDAALNPAPVEAAVAMPPENAVMPPVRRRKGA